MQVRFPDAPEQVEVQVLPDWAKAGAAASKTNSVAIAKIKVFIVSSSYCTPTGAIYLPTIPLTDRSAAALRSSGASLSRSSRLMGVWVPALGGLNQN